MEIGIGNVSFVIFILALVFVFKTINVVPQQHAWVVERLGKYHATLGPGLNIVVPFVDRIAYKHVLKEIPLDVPPQVCITKDNTQLQVDGILYFQITDAMRASYGSSNYIAAITQLAQTTLRSVIGRMELDKTFEEREHINTAIVNAIDESAANWGVKVLRYEIKDLTPPTEILHAMQAQITAERSKRALIAGSEGEKQAAINRAQGEAAAITAIADATAGALREVGAAIQSPGGSDAVNLKVAEKYVSAFAELAKTNNSLIVPANLGDMSGLIATAMQVVKTQKS
jgi:regulator of protease activity HflC (stomatin/prohibitin superfamily)